MALNAGMARRSFDSTTPTSSADHVQSCYFFQPNDGTSHCCPTTDAEIRVHEFEPNSGAASSFKADKLRITVELHQRR
jgi:hypothetical protein